MSKQQILFGVLELLVSVLISFVLVFLSYRWLLTLTRRFDDERQLKKKNTAVGLVLGSILLGQAIVIKQAVYPVMAVIQLYITDVEKSSAAFFKMLGLSVAYPVLAGVLAMGCILFSFWLFDRITPNIDQYKEVCGGNMAVAVFMALLVLAISLLVSSGVAGLTKALIPFPKVGVIPAL